MDMFSLFLDFIRSNFGVISTLAAMIGGAFWLKMDSKYAKKSDVGEMNRVIDSHASRLNELENKVDNLPTAADFANLQVLMTEIKGETKSTNTQVQGISHQVGLLLESKLKE